MGEDPHYNDIDFDLDWLDDFDVSSSSPTSKQTEQPSRARDEQAPAAERQYIRQPDSVPDQPRTHSSRSTQGQQPVRRSSTPTTRNTNRQAAPAMSDYEQARQGRGRTSRPSRTAQEQPRARQTRPASKQPHASSRSTRDTGRRATPAVSDYEQTHQRRGRASRPSRRRGKINVPLTILSVVLAAGLLFAGWQLVSILLDYHRDSSAYNDLADQATAMLAEQDEVAAPEATASADVQDGEHISEVPISVDWDYLQSINEEIIGWLYCPDTVINYPVMQTSDNSYYLYRNYKNESAGAGALFADMDSVPGIARSNLIVYGHNMKNDSMFGTLEEYKDQDYYDEHPTLYFLTPSASYRIDLIAAHIVESTLDNYPTYFEDESEYQEYLDYITSHSFFIADTAASTQYQLFTMSTCDYTSGYEDPRLLVQGMMVPIT